MPKLYIAVVDRTDGAPSQRPDRIFAAYVDEDRDRVIRQALAARAKWGQDVYRVLVGELTGEVREPARYEVVMLS